jgi:hypothetical protein
MVVLVSDHRLPPRPDLQSGRPNIIIFLIHQQSKLYIPNLHASHPPTPWKGNPRQPWAPPSALTHTTKLAPTGQKHFIDFGCYRWGESHSPCFIFSRNFTDVASRTSITISPRLRPGLPSQRWVLPSRQDKLLHLHPETHAVHITPSRINIANIKIGRMRFAPTLTNVR